MLGVTCALVGLLAGPSIGCGGEVEVPQTQAPEFFVGAEIEGTATELGEGWDEQHIEDFEYESGEEELGSSFGGGYELIVDDISIFVDDVEPAEYVDDEMQIVWRGLSRSGHSSRNCTDVGLPWVEIEKYEYGIAVGSFAAIICDTLAKDIHISGSFVASVEEE